MTLPIHMVGVKRKRRKKMVEFFILLAYTLGTGFGFYLGLAKGRKLGIVDTIDQLVEQGYLKYKGVKSNPEIMKYDEDY